jgi:iron(III) transport system permease protein
LVLITSTIDKHSKKTVRTSSKVLTVSIYIGVAFILLPLTALVILALQPSGDLWPHLFSTILPRSIETTFWLLLGVGLLSGSMGTGAAWLVVMCRFPGRRFFEWALLLPLAFPTYITAYCYTEFFEYTGPVQTLIRDLFGFTSGREYWFFQIRSLGGAIAVMSFVLFPYSYLTTRAVFLMQSACALDVSRTLGAKPLQQFFQVALPLARPAVAVGVALALMECINDIGAVEFFGVRTLTFTVYDTWLNRGSLSGAAQIACIMLLLVAFLLWVERYNRRKQRFHTTSSRYRTLPSYHLKGIWRFMALAGCLVPLILGFVLPAGVLLDTASRRLDMLTDPMLLDAALNSLILALAAACVTVCFGLILVYAPRLSSSSGLKIGARFASIGYAIPGTVLAIGILIPVAWFDNTVDAFSRSFLGVSTGLLLIGSGAALVMAYTIRFLAVSSGTLESGLKKISPHLDMAARTLGRSERQTLTEIHIPLLQPAVLTAMLLVFVDSMKELPATLLLRPFNFETLSTTVYTQASRGAFEDGSVAALIIIAVGILPVILLARTTAMTFRDIKGLRGFPIRKRSLSAA